MLRNQLHAGISYDTTGGVITTNRANGCSAAYVGVGVSDITLDRALDNTEMALLATIHGANIGSVRYTNTSGTVKRMTCRDEAAGAMAVGERPIDVALVAVNRIDRRFIQAAGNYNGSAAAAATAFCQRGGVVARTGAGVYTITLDREINQRNCAVIVTVGAGAGAAVDNHVRVVHTSDLVKTVTIESLVAGADIDADFCWAVFNMQCSQNLDSYGVGSIDAAGGNPVGRGCLPARNGAGDYRYALDQLAAAGTTLDLATPVGATGHAIRVIDVAGNARRDVETQIQAGAAQNDSDHALVCLRM